MTHARRLSDGCHRNRRWIFLRLNFARNKFYWRDKLIPALRQSLNVNRPRGIIAKRGANLRDAKVKSALKINECFVAPNRRTQFLARNSSIGILNQASKHASGLRLQMNDRTLSPQFPRFCVKLENAKAITTRFHAHILARLRRRVPKSTLTL